MSTQKSRTSSDSLLDRLNHIIAQPKSASQYQASRSKEAQVESAKTQAGLAADFTPILGEGKSFYEGIQDLREGNYGMGALGIAGAVPLFGYGPRVAKRMMKGADELSGNMLSGQSNYIPNHYGNDNKAIPPTAMEQGIGETIVGAMKGGQDQLGQPFAGVGAPPMIRKPIVETKLPQAEVAAAGKKATGFAGWISDSPLNIMDAVFNPKSRALYADTGINAKTQKSVQNILKQIDENPENASRLLDKAVGQVIYNTHIGEQAGRVGSKADVMDEMSKYAYLGDAYTPVTKEAFKNGVKQTKTMRGKRELKVSDADLDTAYDVLQSNFDLGEGAKLVIKQPTGKSGNHLGDMAAKNPANKFIRQAAKKLQDAKGTTTKEQWKDTLVDMSDGEKNYRVIKQDKDGGVWIRSGTKVEPFRGSAIVEGGVAGLTKVYPNGRSINFMFDQHDFLEKLPVIGKALRKLLPNDVVAVAGPMHLNLLDTGWAKGIKTSEKVKPSLVKDPTRANQAEVKGMLEEIANAKPSAEQVAKQRQIVKENVAVTGGGMLTGAVAANRALSEEEE